MRSYQLVLALAIAWTLAILGLVFWFCPCLAEAADSAGARIVSAPRTDGVTAYLVDVVKGPAALAGEYPAAADGSADIPLPVDLAEGTIEIHVTACGQAKPGEARPCSYAVEFSFPFPAPMSGPAGLRVLSRP